MRKSLIALLSACLSLPAFALAPGFTTITASNVVDAGGNPLASGTATFQVVDAGARPLSVQIAGGGQIVTAPVSVQIVNGMFSATVVDVSSTLPSFPCVVLTITDNSTGAIVWQDKCLQPMGGIYDLDQFTTNTSPILPRAGDTVEGNLGVNGNMSVTGTLSVGGLSLAQISATNGSIQILNGSINAALFAGADIGAKVNNAFASCTDAAPCHVYIPPGLYSYATTISLPFMAQGLEFTCDRNAKLTFTGTGDGLRTAVAVNGGNAGGTLLDGGCGIVGTSVANSGVHIRPSAGVQMKDFVISGFTNGPGVWVDGANAVTISGGAIHDNKKNISLTGNMCNGSNACEWDRNSSGAWVFTSLSGASGFAANAVHVTGVRILNGAQWGVTIGDVVGGSVSASFNNTFDEDTFEGNGSSGLGGAMLVGFATETNIEHNYYEGNDNGIVEGCVPGSPSIVTAPTGYTAQFCGTATGTRVESNFWNDPATADEVHYNFANSPVTNYNIVSGPAACFLDSNSYTGSLSINANAVFGGGSKTCAGGSAGSNAVAGTPGGSLAGYVEDEDTTTGDKHFRGNVNIDNALFTAGLLTANTGVATLAGGGSIVGKIGPISIWEGAGDPGGTCSSLPQTTADIWFSPLGISVCQGGTWVKVGH